MPLAQGYAKDQPAGFSNRIERVAIVGAAGYIGRHITSHLLQTTKHTVTAITRPASTNEFPPAVHVARVDYTSTAPSDFDALVAALRGQQALIISINMRASPDIISNLIRAAAQADVNYVLPNWYSVDVANEKLIDESLFRQTRDRFRGEIEKLGVSAHLWLVCNYWYEFSLAGFEERFGFDMQKREVVLFGEGEVRINTTTWAQCGRAVAGLLSLKELAEDEGDDGVTLEGFRNRGVYVSSFRVSQRDMFESVMRVTGTGEGDWTVTKVGVEGRWEGARKAVLEGGDLMKFIRLIYSRIFFAGGGGDYEGSRGLDNEALGLPVEDLDEATKVAVKMGLDGMIKEYL
ncbi:hypothetical protein FQN55_006532 [Onygenales sp. PD_40]|nr:hypothetical protein FQN55_006532 [Onygenales sp. PD_40]KAK2798114.1 hypothetical protein FQN51_007933 [Onygenales sp. PD_10]